MATLTVQDVVRAGLEATYASAAAGGDEMPNNDGKKMFLHVVNGGGSDCVMTITTTAVVDGLAVADRTVTVTAAEERFIGPFPIEYYSTTVAIAYDQVTSVTIAALRLP